MKTYLHSVVAQTLWPCVLYSIVLSLCVTSTKAQCFQEKIPTDSQFRLFLRSDSPNGACKEWILGAQDQKKVLLLLMRDPLINCANDNIQIYDENQFLVYDFCAQKPKDPNFTYVTGSYKSFKVVAKIKGVGSIFSSANFVIFDRITTTTSSTGGGNSSSGISSSSFIPFPIPSTSTRPSTTIFNTNRPTLSFSSTFPTFTTPFSSTYPTFSNRPSFSSTNLPRSNVFTLSKYEDIFFINKNNEACGVPAIQPRSLNSFSARIIGGIESIPHSWPWQVFITDLSTVCGAVLLNNEWIVTAAHCAKGMTRENIRVTLGAHDRFGIESTQKRITASKVFVNPGYNTQYFYDGDIALMKLSQRIEFTNEISPVCLPPPNVNYATPGTLVTVTGWGETRSFSDRNLLRQVNLPIIDSSNCQVNSENQICAGNEGNFGGFDSIKDACRGDSGGPMVLKVDNRYTLVGIVSWGMGCVGKSGYVRVSSYVNWINSIINFN